jgi:hypothetical protein
MMPPEPSRMRLVSAPMRASMISGAVQASSSMAWCSDIQKRRKPRDSTCWASAMEFLSACAGVEPEGTGDWSRTERRRVGEWLTEIG